MSRTFSGVQLRVKHHLVVSTPGCKVIAKNESMVSKKLAKCPTAKYIILGPKKRKQQREKMPLW